MNDDENKINRIVAGLYVVIFCFWFSCWLLRYGGFLASKIASLNLRWRFPMPAEQPAPDALAAIRKAMRTYIADFGDYRPDLDGDEISDKAARQFMEVAIPHLPALLDELDGLRKLARRLPRTADRAFVEIGMRIWRRGVGDEPVVVFDGIVRGYEKPGEGEPWWVECREWSSPLCDCYSTEEAARTGNYSNYKSLPAASAKEDQ